MRGVHEIEHVGGLRMADGREVVGRKGRCDLEDACDRAPARPHRQARCIDAREGETVGVGVGHDKAAVVERAHAADARENDPVPVDKPVAEDGHARG